MYINKKILFTAALILILGPLIFLSASYNLKEISQTNQVKAATTSSYDLVAVDQTTDQQAKNFPDQTMVTISHQVVKGDTLYSIATKYHADPQTILDYPYNNIADDLKLSVGETIIIPNGYISNPPPSAKPVIGNGQLAWPVIGPVSQYASWFHPGAIDIASPLLTPIHAAEGGVVLEINHFVTGYGNHVILDSGGLTILYAHLSKIDVQKGQTLKKGDFIGLSGSTGRSTGPHLHFEVRKSGQPVNPMSLLGAR